MVEHSAIDDSAMLAEEEEREKKEYNNTVNNQDDLESQIQHSTIRRQVLFVVFFSVVYS